MTRHNFGVLQPVRVQMAPNQVQMATMYIVDLNDSRANLRMAAMNQRDPIHSFMFDRAGMLLEANAAARAVCQTYINSPGLSAQALLLHTHVAEGASTAGLMHKLVATLHQQLA